MIDPMMLFRQLAEVVAATGAQITDDGGITTIVAPDGTVTHHISLELIEHHAPAVPFHTRAPKG